MLADENGWYQDFEKTISGIVQHLETIPLRSLLFLMRRLLTGFHLHPRFLNCFHNSCGKLTLLAVTLLLAACLPIDAPTATETPVPADTPSPTATILWFPPSPTPTPNAIPTYTSTPEMSPGVGSQILKDNFTDQKVWDTVTSEQASVILKDRHLTLAVEPGVSIASFRRDMTFGNFYAEITARIGLCRADDTYGLLLRAAGTSFYRFNLSCNGFMTVERIKSGERLPLLEPTTSGDIPLGPPGEVLIGIWAVGGELRFFLNGRFQVSVNERTFPSGGLGVFVQSKEDTPVTISFSDLTVYDVNYTPPTKTPVP